MGKVSLLINYLKYIASLHLYTFIHAYDPILDSECPFTFDELPKLKTQFLAIISVCLFSGIYGTLLLEYDAKGFIELSRLPQSSHIFTHQVFPRLMWIYTDMLMLVVFFGSVSLYAALLATPTMRPKFRMYKTGDTVVMGDKG